MSSTEFDNIPTSSNVLAIDWTPNLEIEPYVGINPTTLQQDAGCLLDPPVSVPKLTTAISALILAADPDEEPPGINFVSTGFFVGPK